MKASRKNNYLLIDLLFSDWISDLTSFVNRHFSQTPHVTFGSCRRGNSVAKFNCIKWKVVCRLVIKNSSSTCLDYAQTSIHIRGNHLWKLCKLQWLLQLTFRSDVEVSWLLLNFALVSIISVFSLASRFQKQCLCELGRIKRGRLNIGQAHAAPAHVYSLSSRNGLFDRTKDSTETAYASEATFISFGLLITLVLFAVLCTGGCCLSIFGKRQQEDNHTMGFSNPIADLANTSNTISSIDVRALDMGQIEFEPLPRLQDLTAVSNYTYGNYRRGDSANRNLGVDSPFIQVTAIVPTDEASIYAHDWFDEPYHNFPRTHIEYVKEVGKGWFGKVIESEAKDIVPYTKNLRVLVKVLREDASGTEQMRFLDESRLYRESNHGNILKLLGHSIEKLPFLLIMEHCPQGDLKSFLIANVSRAELLYSQGALLRMGHDIAKGLEWMSSAGFIHKDLATRNCQVGSEGRIIIGDYGLSVQNFRDDYYWGSNVAIPLRWSAPETFHCTINTIQTLKVLKPSNVWTFGVVLWEIFEFGKLPYSELSDDDVISRVITDRNYTLGQFSRPGFALKDELYKIMLSCWNPQPDSRPSISAIVGRLGELCGSVSDRHLSQNVSVKLPASFIKEDDFDRKWDEFAKKVNSPQEQGNTLDLNSDVKHQSEILNFNNNNNLTGGKKKSVSFLGLGDEISVVQVKTKLSTVNQFQVPDQYGKHSETVSSQSATPVNSHELNLNSSSNLITESQSAPFLSDSSGGGVSSDRQLWKVNRDPEEDSWRKRIELGEISQKVKEKSQSVQDLMVLTHVEPSDLSDPDSLVIACNQWQNAKPSSAPPRGVSDLAGTGTFSSIMIEDAILRNPSNDNALTQVALASTKEATASSNSGESDNADVTNSESQVLSEDATSHEYYEDVSSLGNLGPSKLQALQNLSGNGRSLSLLASTGTSLLRLNQTSHDDVSDTKTSSNIESSSSAMSSSVVVPTLINNLHSYSQGLPAPNTNVSRGGGCVHNVFPTSQQSAEVASAFIKGRKVQKNFRNSKPSTPNFSPASNETDVGDNNSSFFQRNDNVFEDFSMEFNDPVRPIGNVTPALRLQTIDCSDEEKYGQSNVLLGPSEDLGLNLYQRLTTELVNECTSPCGSDSTDYLDNLGDSRQSQSMPHAEDSSMSIKRNLELESDISLPYENSVEKSTEASGTEISSVNKTHEPISSMLTKKATRDERPEQWVPGVGEASISDTCVPTTVDIIGRDTFLEDIEAAADELGSLVMTDLDEENPEITVIKETHDEEEHLELDVASRKPALNAFENASEKLEDATICVNSTPKPSTDLGIAPHESEVTFVTPNSEKLLSDAENVFNEAKTESSPSIKSPEQKKLEGHANTEAPDLPVTEKTSMKKSVSFERKKIQLVYQYPPPPPPSDSDDEEKHTRSLGSSAPFSSALDWELQPEELDNTAIHLDDSEDEVIQPKVGNPMDVYRISTDLDNFLVRPSTEPFVFSPVDQIMHVGDFTHNQYPSPASALYTSLSGTSTLGELRHTRNKLKLDLSKGEASLLDGENGGDLTKLSTGKPQQLDSGVGSSTNVSPFQTCDNQS
ncbi:unnamed protein product [Allacma fusca]|uniref:Protein kinase domain-containing protein n=1 Tax=Allacma fusca TaxID=39272 RepID=A0A8J2JXT2_9HEXA|nr:unnamed protein product [Allacma fusca]